MCFEPEVHLNRDSLGEGELKMYRGDRNRRAGNSELSLGSTPYERRLGSKSGHDLRGFLKGKANNLSQEPPVKSIVGEI